MGNNFKNKTYNLVDGGINNCIYMNKHIRVEGGCIMDSLDFDRFICLHFSTFIFILGVVGLVLNNKNLIYILIYVDLMFFGLVLHSIFISFLTHNPVGFIYSLFVISLAVVETVVGLSIFVLKFRYGAILTSQSLISTR